MACATVMDTLRSSMTKHATDNFRGGRTQRYRAATCGHSAVVKVE